MGTLPAVDQEAFEDFTGKLLSEGEWDRVEILVDRARRNLRLDLDLADVTLDDDDTADLRDAVAQLGWFYWEGERLGVMEIIATPVSQLSSGTLFWTKEKGLPSLGAVSRVLGRWGVRGSAGRVLLEGELAHPHTVVP